MQRTLRDLAASTTGLRLSPVRLAARTVRNRKRTIHVTHGPQFVTGTQDKPLPSGHARTLLGKPGTLSVGSPMKFLRPKYLSKRMQRIYKQKPLP